jgi:hypothetical protein
MFLNMELLVMIVGFTLAAYAIVANDVIQTLGTFLSSNSHRPWWVLWLFAMAVLSATLIYGWMAHGGDSSYGRLAKFPQPPEFTIVYLFPPLLLLALTRFGIPVSTTFLVLTVFVTANLPSMLVKSLLGYVVAFGTGLVIYRLVFARAEKHFLEKDQGEIPRGWVLLQWLSTGFLWSQWLTHDLANIFVYAPSVGTNAEGVRTISLTWLIGALAWFFVLHAWIFYSRGGNIQRIVNSKTNIEDIRSATLVDFIYALILIVFNQMSSIPMSTTWVFLGLLAGREFAIAWITHVKSNREVFKIAGNDLVKAAIGLALSLGLALAAPLLHDLFPHEHKEAAEDQSPSASPVVVMG